MQRPDINKLKKLKQIGEDATSYLLALHNANLIEYVEELEQTIKEARAEFVKELEGMEVPLMKLDKKKKSLFGKMFDGLEQESILFGQQIADEEWRKQRDALITKYKEV